MMMSLNLDNTLAMSLVSSLPPKPMSFGPRYTACPPSKWNPVSKLTRVRSDGLVKIIHKVLPSKGRNDRSPELNLALISDARSRSCWTFASSKSLIAMNEGAGGSSPWGMACVGGDGMSQSEIQKLYPEG